MPKNQTREEAQKRRIRAAEQAILDDAMIKYHLGDADPHARIAYELLEELDNAQREK